VSTEPTVYVAEKADGVIHIEERFTATAGESRVSHTRCGLALDFDSGEVAGRIFHLQFSHVFHDGCEECVA